VTAAARTLLSRTRALFSRRSTDTALSEEIACHLAMLEDEFRAQGCSEADARLRARREFGSVARVRESTREARGFAALDSLRVDIGFALRQLRQARAFTAAAVLTLAVGIGGTTGIFGILDAAAFRPLSYPDPERLVVVHEAYPQFGPFPASAADAAYWSEHVSAFERVSIVLASMMNLTGTGDPERLQVGLASPGLLSMLGARTRIGRLPVDGEAQPGADNVVVLGDALWKRRFGADPGIVGRTIALDGHPHEVIGVLTPEFRAPNIRHLYAIPVPEMVVQAWKPLALAPEDRPIAGGYSYPAIARLTPGISITRAQQELDRVQADLRRDIPAKANLLAQIVPLQDQMASRSRATLLLLLAATGAVLLIGCVNTTNLLSARLLARQREMAIRAAMGAGRWRLMRQVIVENLVLGTLGGAVGLIAAQALIASVVWLGPTDVPRLDEAALDARVFLFAAAVTVCASLLIGAVSARRIAASDLRGWLVNRTGTAGTPVSSSPLVVCEIGACAACVAVALLLAQSFHALTDVDKGFDSGQMLTAMISLPTGRYATPAQQGAFFTAVTDAVRHAPSVIDAAVSTQLPLTGTGSLSALSSEGTTVPLTERPSADVRSVTPEYFQVVHLRLKSGRLLARQDRERPVAVISERLAAQAWPGQDPLGRRFRLGGNPAASLFEDVGIVADVRGTALDQPVTPMAYVPFPQRARNLATIIVKTSGNPSSVAPVVRQALRTIDPELPLPLFRTFDDVIGASLDARRFQLTLIGLFAALAVVLAGVGVYAVMAYSVAQRRGELGVRLALGASPRGLLTLVLGRAFRLGLAGLAVALPLGWLAGSGVRSFLYGVTPFDPGTLALTAAVTLLVACAAAAIPAVRASRLEPLVALRLE
jgi:putative ABC transport system permease protein